MIHGDTTGLVQVSCTKSVFFSFCLVVNRKLAIETILIYVSSLLHQSFYCLVSEETESLVKKSLPVQKVIQIVAKIVYILFKPNISGIWNLPEESWKEARSEAIVSCVRARIKEWNIVITRQMNNWNRSTSWVELDRMQFRLDLLKQATKAVTKTIHNKHQYFTQDSCAAHDVFVSNKKAAVIDRGLSRIVQNWQLLWTKL